MLLLLSACGGDTPASTGETTSERGATTRERASAPPEPPDRALAYVSLGDSLAVGVGASEPDSKGFAPLHREQLERQTGRKVRLIQLGISGETTDSFVNGPDPQLARAEQAIRENPGAVVTLSLGANDLLRTAEETDAAREAALARYAVNLDSILKTLTSASAPGPSVTVLALYNPAPGTFTNVWAGRLNEVIREVSRRNGAAVAPVDLAFQGREAEYTLYPRFGDIHPTDAGYAAMARALAAPERG